MDSWTFHENLKKFPDTDLGRERVSSFFSLFYASINAGSLLSTFISPILREKVKCFDRDDCYFVAFLVPACLMAVAILGWFFKNYRLSIGSRMTPNEKN